jgi:hypothetical protein
MKVREAADLRTAIETLITLLPKPEGVAEYFLGELTTPKRLLPQAQFDDDEAIQDGDGGPIWWA